MIAIKIMEGYSYDEIAKEIGLSKMAITKRMRKYGK
jgi:transposase